VKPVGITLLIQTYTKNQMHKYLF